MTWKALIEQKPWSNGLNLRLARIRLDSIDVVQPLVFKTHGRDELVPEEEIALSGFNWSDSDDVRGFLQAVVDAAWEIGVRPAAAKDQTSELKAVREHLADMRTLALPAPSERTVHS